MLRLSLCIGIMLLIAGSAHASDAPYGSETLVYQLRQAHLVVRVQNAEIVYKKTSPTVIGYRVTFRHVLFGHTCQRVLTVEFPGLGSAPEEKEFSGGILFIAKFDEQHFASDASLIRKAQKERQKAAMHFITATSARSKLRWARTYIQSSDASLQRSSVWLIGDLVSTHQEEVFTFLTDALKNPKVSPVNKVEAIRVISAIKSPKVVPVLRHIAENPKEWRSVREESVMMMVGLPGWREILDAMECVAG